MVQVLKGQQSACSLWLYPNVPIFVGMFSVLVHRG